VIEAEIVIGSDLRPQRGPLFIAGMRRTRLRTPAGSPD